MPLFICRVWKNNPVGREGQALKWVYPRDMDDLPMPPADIPMVRHLQDNL
jgi:8-oxo-dGTP diphosphatase